MNGRTHLVGGVTAALIYITASVSGDFGLEPMSLVQMGCTVPIAMIGSLAPDIDLRTSTMGSAVKPLSALINGIVGHRTFFHSPLFLILLFFAAKAYLPEAMMWMTTAFIVGAVSHLYLDMLNKAGIPLLWPIKKRFWVLGIKTSGRGEKIVVSIMFVLMTWICVQLICGLVPVK